MKITRLILTPTTLGWWDVEAHYTGGKAEFVYDQHLGFVEGNTIRHIEQAFQEDFSATKSAKGGQGDES